MKKFLVAWSSPFLHHQPFFGGAMVLWMVLHRQFNTINYVLFWYLRRNSSIFTEKALFCIFYNENYKRDLYRDLTEEEKTSYRFCFVEKLKKKYKYHCISRRKSQRNNQGQKMGFVRSLKKIFKNGKKENRLSDIENARMENEHRVTKKSKPVSRQKVMMNDS